jgi:prepilin-type N-terminal cleavage/methylation domain-containing protein
MGFTLIELLMVIAVIAILFGITFGITRGVQSAQNRTKAKAELASLSQALERFKAQYGDYPWLDSADDDDNKMLLFALTGRLVMERNSSTGVVSVSTTVSQDDEDVISRPKFIDESKYTLSTDDAGNSIAILDPWGNSYVYKYKVESSSGDWDVFGYHLYSTGPDGDDANTEIENMMNLSSGVLADGFRDVANEYGIIFAGE